MAEYKTTYKNEDISQQNSSSVVVETIQVSKNINVDSAFLQIKLKNSSNKILNAVQLKISVEYENSEEETIVIQNNEITVNPNDEFTLNPTTLSHFKVKDISLISVDASLESVAKKEVSVNQSNTAKKFKLNKQSLENTENREGCPNDADNARNVNSKNKLRKRKINKKIVIIIIVATVAIAAVVVGCFVIPPALQQKEIYENIGGDKIYERMDSFPGLSPEKSTLTLFKDDNGSSCANINASLYSVPGVCIIDSKRIWWHPVDSTDLNYYKKVLDEFEIALGVKGKNVTNRDTIFYTSNYRYEVHMNLSSNGLSFPSGKSTYTSVQQYVQ